MQALSYSRNTWFENKFKCTTKVRINYITVWSFLGSSRCTTWNYCILLLKSLTVGRVNSKLNKRLKYVGIYLNLWNWILSPYERVPKKHQCQDALCTLCKAHTFVQFLNTKMVGKTANNYYIALKGFLRKYPTWLRQMNCWFLLFNCLVYACEPKGEFDIWSWFTSKSLIPFHLVYHVCSLIFAMLKNTKLRILQNKHKYTVEPPLMATSLQQPFFGRQSIHSLLFQPLYTAHLSTMATFFCPQGGHCRGVQLQ